MPARRATVALLTALGAGALGGCGDEGPAAGARAGHLVVTLDEFRVRPERIRVPAGRLRIVARNAGVLAHDVAVLPGRRPLDPSSERRFGTSATALPGQVVALTVRLRPGRYRLACVLSNHDNLGEYADLEVVPRG
jgi:uncharacterized cupredoxin-like copper-binding protein